MQIPTYKMVVSNVGQIMGKNVSTYNCENLFFFFCFVFLFSVIFP